MRISIIKEENKNEQRVASTPNIIKLLERFGAEVLIEEGAGDLSGYGDEFYKSAGAKVTNRSECLQSDICLCVRMPTKNDIGNMKKGLLLVGILNPYENKDYFSDLNNNNITACCMELIPRISRAYFLYFRNIRLLDMNLLNLIQVHNVFFVLELV